MPYSFKKKYSKVKIISYFRLALIKAGRDLVLAHHDLEEKTFGFNIMNIVQREGFVFTFLTKHPVHTFRTLKDKLVVCLLK